jgi:hypothetical protein
MRTMSTVLFALALLSGSLASAGGEAAMKPITWEIDNLEQIGGMKPTVLGAPTPIEVDGGKALLFDGVDDGLVLDANPVEGLAAFTVEVLFRPDAGGLPEQRFFHIQANDSEDRALLETRLPGGDTWYGDVYLQVGRKSKALNDPAFTHPIGGWHVLALVYDGKQLRQYVDGVLELRGSLGVPPLADGRTAIGVRLNEVCWFKGAIRRVRITAQALSADALLKP